MFRHPQYYKNLRKLARLRNRNQAISSDTATAASERAPGTGLKPQATSAKLQAPSFEKNKWQASSPKLQASSSKPRVSNSKIWDPRKSFTVHEPRCWTKIKVLCGCFTWKLIWWGENLTLLLFVTFNSIVKKWPEALQTNRSGVPCKLEFSSLMSEKSLKCFLIFW